MTDMRKLVFGLLACALCGGCGHQKRDIRIPASVLETKAEEPAARPYVIKMSDGQRTWQIEIPAGGAAPAFQARIPLASGSSPLPPAQTAPTEADRQLMNAHRGRGGSVDDQAPSYLKSLAVVRNLFQQQQYELALVELVKLERSFPSDVRILEMKGSLLRRLGRTQEAKAAWEKALGLEPDNDVVARALESLGEEGR